MFRKLLSRAFSLATSLALIGTAPATAAGYDLRAMSKQDAAVTVRRAQEHFTMAAPEVAINAATDQSTQEFDNRDPSTFVHEMHGVNIANGSRPVLVGTTLIPLTVQSGKFIQQKARTARPYGRRWIDHNWPNPHTLKLADKSGDMETLTTTSSKADVCRPNR